MGVAYRGEFLSGSGIESLCISRDKILPVLCGRRMRLLGIGKAFGPCSVASDSASGGC